MKNLLRFALVLSVSLCNARPAMAAAPQDFGELIGNIQRAFDADAETEVWGNSLAIFQLISASSVSDIPNYLAVLHRQCQTQGCLGISNVVFVIMDWIDKQPALPPAEKIRMIQDVGAAASQAGRDSTKHLPVKYSDEEVIFTVPNSILRELVMRKSSTPLESFANIANRFIENMGCGERTQDGAVDQSTAILSRSIIGWPRGSQKAAAQQPGARGMAASSSVHPKNTASAVGLHSSSQLRAAADMAGNDVRNRNPGYDPCAFLLRSRGGLSQFSNFDCRDQGDTQMEWVTLETGELGELMRKCFEASTGDGNPFATDADAWRTYQEDKLRTSSGFGEKDTTEILWRGGNNFAYFWIGKNGKVYIHEYSYPLGEGAKERMPLHVVLDVAAQELRDEADQADAEARDAAIAADHAEEAARQAETAAQEARESARRGEFTEDEAQEAEAAAKTEREKATTARQEAEKKEKDAREKREKAEKTEKEAREAKAAADAKGSGTSGSLSAFRMNMSDSNCQKLDALWRRGRDSASTLSGTERKPPGRVVYPNPESDRGADQGGMPLCTGPENPHFQPRAACQFQMCGRAGFFSFESCGCSSQAQPTRPIVESPDDYICMRTNCPSGFTPQQGPEGCECVPTEVEKKKGPKPVKGIGGSTSTPPPTARQMPGSPSQNPLQQSRRPSNPSSR